jgi:hypothetical protein
VENVKDYIGNPADLVKALEGWFQTRSNIFSRVKHSWGQGGTFPKFDKVCEEFGMNYIKVFLEAKVLKDKSALVSRYNSFMQMMKVFKKHLGIDVYNVLLLTRKPNELDNLTIARTLIYETVSSQESRLFSAKVASRSPSIQESEPKYSIAHRMTKWLSVSGELLREHQSKVELIESQYEPMRTLMNESAARQQLLSSLSRSLLNLGNVALDPEPGPGPKPKNISSPRQEVIKSDLSKNLPEGKSMLSFRRELHEVFNPEPQTLDAVHKVANAYEVLLTSLGNHNPSDQILFDATMDYEKDAISKTIEQMTQSDPSQFILSKILLALRFHDFITSSPGTSAILSYTKWILHEVIRKLYIMLNTMTLARIQMQVLPLPAYEAECWSSNYAYEPWKETSTASRDAI